VWLENFLRKYTKILLLVSHSQDFLNNVCTNIILVRERERERGEREGEKQRWEKKRKKKHRRMATEEKRGGIREETDISFLLSVASTASVVLERRLRHVREIERERERERERARERRERKRRSRVEFSFVSSLQLCGDSSAG
jgi:ATP-binding cassette, subfamily F, member 2